MFKSSRKEVKYYGPEVRYEIIVDFMVYTGKQELQELLRVVQWMRDFYLPDLANRRRVIYEEILNTQVPWTTAERDAAIDYDNSAFKLFKKKPRFYEDAVAHEKQEQLTSRALDEALNDIQTYRLIHEELLTAEKMLQHLFYYEDRDHHLQRAILLYRRHA